MNEQERTGEKQGQSATTGFDTRFQPGQSGNRRGRPRARRSLSQVIQDTVNDPTFESTSPRYQTNPLHKIVGLAVQEAMSPQVDVDTRRKAREWIAVNGYGVRLDLSERPITSG